MQLLTWFKNFWSNHICGGSSEAEEKQDRRDEFGKDMARVMYKVNHFCHCPNDYVRMNDDVKRLRLKYPDPEFAESISKLSDILNDYRTGMRLERIRPKKVG